MANTTIYKQMNDSLLAEQAFAIDFDEFVDKGYHYGRDLISGSFFSLIRNTESSSGSGFPFSVQDDPDNSVDEFESKVLELWDRLYQVLKQAFFVTIFQIGSAGPIIYY